MSSINSKKGFPLILGGILVLALMVVAAAKSGKFPNFVDPYGLLFVLVGGMALVVISFPGAEIRRAFQHAAGSPGNDTEIRLSAYFWEAAARGFWMLGGLRSVLNIMISFIGMASEENAGVQGVIDDMARSLLAVFYGILLAVICLIPSWKLIGKLQIHPSSHSPELSGAPISFGRLGLRLSTVIGYVLFGLILALTVRDLSIPLLWNALPVVYWPSLFVVLGGVLALILFIGTVNVGPPLSLSFAIMGLVGSLMAFIQTLFGMASPDTIRAIQSIAGGINFILSSCLTALLGMILIGAPLEDRAIRLGRVPGPSAFSRASWYAFPLLTLILVPLVVVLITTPMPRSRPQVTEVSAPVQEQRARYEARAPQSEPMDFMRANIQERYLIYKVNPAYPEQAKQEGIQGAVKLTIVINEEGFVYEVKGNPGNDPILEKAAIPAVKRWRFSPFLIKDVPVAIETTVTVNFALKQ